MLRNLETVVGERSIVAKGLTTAKECWAGGSKAPNVSE